MGADAGLRCGVPTRHPAHTVVCGPTRRIGAFAALVFTSLFACAPPGTPPEPAVNAASHGAARSAGRGGPARAVSPSRPAAGTSAAELAAAARGKLVVCTENLWNYGLPSVVHALRRPNVSESKVAADLARQEPALAERMADCDVAAVQELVAENDSQAQQALDRLASLVSARSGHRFEARIADTRDVIRNGFLVRADASFRVEAFDGAHSSDRFPSMASFPRGQWDRGPAELLLAIPAGTSGRASRPALRIRIIDAHLKSKTSKGDKTDPYGEQWERLRILQAQALAALATRRAAADPSEIILIVGDFNNDRGSATRTVAAGSIDPMRLVSPEDCLGAQGQIVCSLPQQEALFLPLADLDPDLRGKGTYRFKGREEMIDGIFANPAAARLALEPGSGSGDWSVELAGRFWEGSDHRMLKVTLHY